MDNLPAVRANLEITDRKVRKELEKDKNDLRHKLARAAAESQAIALLAEFNSELYAKLNQKRKHLEQVDPEDVTYLLGLAEIQITAARQMAASQNAMFGRGLGL